MAQRFLKPAVEVEAMQFAGEGNLQEVFSWLQGIIYIKQGLDNEFRLPTEYGDELEVLADAPPFGIIQTRSGYERVDIGDWIVKYDDIRITTYEPMDFALKFVEVDD